MSGTSIAYFNDQWGKVNPQVLRLEYKITAAKTVVPVIQNSGSLVTFDAFASQAVMDAFLGTTSEFLLAAFDATSMGAQCFGGLVDMKGQAKKVTSMRATYYTAGAWVAENGAVPSSTLTASTKATETAVGAYGNLAFKIDFGSGSAIDTSTSGLVVVELGWISI